MVDQPAIQPCGETDIGARWSADHAQHDKSERRKHQHHCRERVSREHDRLAAAEPDMVECALRQQQQRRGGVHHIDRMLIGNLPPHREQPARKQIGIEHHREQDRQHQACGRGRDQADLLPPRQRQEIQRGQHRAVHQLKRGDEAEQRSADDAQPEASIVVDIRRRETKQQCQRSGAERAAHDGEIAGGRDPFEADEGAERPEHPEHNLARAAAVAAEPGQQQAAQHGEQQKHAAVMTDEKAARAERTERVERHRQIGIREFCALQVFHKIRIEPVDMRIDRRAIDAHVPAVFHIEREVAEEIAEHQQRHQRDQAIEPDLSRRAETARRSRPSCWS
ncbi:hypothetical protein JQ631_27220 [Bradyrhizobium manausense]|uniref:hypothetical protein n=1 Tax=Bradyrhizobium manausense TaxID=989370 RepID=UPI001BA6C34A|nr:hypothetical protein [Bradyrhizobium manausense]MBR0792781.1 hypothetical protein [Bradyrhizobium manausense]